MNILIVSQYFWPENFRVNDLVQGLVERGHEVTVLTGQPNYPSGRFFEGYGWRSPREENVLGARVIRVPLVPRGKGGGLRLLLNYLSFVFAACLGVLFRLKRHERFDVIFVFEPSPITVGIPAALARLRFRAPILFWVLDLWPESLSATGAVSQPWILGLIRAGVRWIYAQCSRVLVQSRAFVPNIAALGVPPERINYFPNWIEAGYEGIAGRPDEDQDSGSRDKVFKIVFAGNIGAAQDFPAILDAAEGVARELPQVRWVIAGDGRMAPWVREEVAKRGLGGYFRFLGQLPPTAMPELFSTADALLATLRPDTIFSATIPGKIQSYLAAGKPLLAMLDGEGAKVVDESAGGLTCAAGDSAGLARCVVELAGRTAEERLEMGASGRAYAQNEFGRNILFDRLEGWMAEVMEECNSLG